MIEVDSYHHIQGVTTMKLLIPREHGAWAMLILPFLIGLSVHPQWMHLPLFAGWFFLYLSLNPFMMLIKKKGDSSFYRKWLIRYGTLAGVLLIIVAYQYPALLWLGLAMVPLFLINIAFVRRNRERNFWNDVTAVFEMAVGGVASAYVALGQWSMFQIYVWVVSVLFFLGSIFFVKTMIREKKNKTFRYISWGYHLLLMAGVALVTGHLWLTLAYVPALIRAILLGGRNATPLQVGLTEIGNSLLFTILVLCDIYHILSL